MPIIMANGKNLSQDTKLYENALRISQSIFTL